MAKLFRSWGSGTLDTAPVVEKLFQFHDRLETVNDIWSTMDPLPMFSDTPRFTAPTTSSSSTTTHIVTDEPQPMTLSYDDHQPKILNPNISTQYLKQQSQQPQFISPQKNIQPARPNNIVDADMKEEANDIYITDGGDEEDIVKGEKKEEFNPHHTSSSSLSHDISPTITTATTKKENIFTSSIEDSSICNKQLYMQVKSLLLDDKKLVAKDRIFDMHIMVPGLGNVSFLTDPKPERWDSKLNNNNNVNNDYDSLKKQLIFVIRMKDHNTGKDLYPNVMVSVKKPHQSKSLCIKDDEAVLSLVIRNATVVEWPPIRKHQRREFTLICWFEEIDRISGNKKQITNKVESDVMQFAGNRRIASKATTVKLLPWSTTNKLVKVSPNGSSSSSSSSLLSSSSSNVLIEGGRKKRGRGRGRGRRVVKRNQQLNEEYKKKEEREEEKEEEINHYKAANTDDNNYSTIRNNNRRQKKRPLSKVKKTSKKMLSSTPVSPALKKTAGNVFRWVTNEDHWTTSQYWPYTQSSKFNSIDVDTAPTTTSIIDDNTTITNIPSGYTINGSSSSGLEPMKKRRVINEIEMTQEEEEEEKEEEEKEEKNGKNFSSSSFDYKLPASPLYNFSNEDLLTTNAFLSGYHPTIGHI